MGKATRWLKSILGLKKEKDVNNGGGGGSSLSSDFIKDRKRFSFGGKSGRETSTSTPTPNFHHQISTKDIDWLKSYLADSEKEQNKHAIAVAAATAAAADAAVAAAQAAVAVVRLTSNGNNNNRAFINGTKDRSAVKIQTVFRGFLVS